MKEFSYKALSAAGEVQTGTMAGQDRAEVIGKLQDKGWLPVTAEPAGLKKQGGAKKSAFYNITLFRKKPGAGEVTDMTRELANMIGAGVSLERSLEILIDISEMPEMAELVTRLLKSIRSGKLFSEALAEQGAPFTPLYISLIRAAETGGALGDVLDHLGDYMMRMQAMRANIISALTYPAILLLVSFVSLFMLLIFVIPQFENLFRGAMDRIPVATRIVMEISKWSGDNWGLVLLLILGAGFLVPRLLKLEKIALYKDRFLLVSPLFGDLIRKMEAARFCRTLSILLQNGVPMLPALQNVQGILANRVMARVVADIPDSLKAGESLSTPLIEDNTFPRLAVHMIRVGEESGRLIQILADVATIYDQEVERSVKRLLSILEPLLIFVFGILIGGIIISILVGIMSVNQLAL